jgi:hypothetical protein
VRGDVKVIRQFRNRALVIAMASTLVVGAFSVPANSAEPWATSEPAAAPAAAATPAASPAAAAATSTASTAPTSAAEATPSVTAMSSKQNVPVLTRGYRLEKRNGEDYYCRRVASTGSRAKSSETCLTLAEITQLREASQDKTNRMRSNPAGMGGMDSAGGSYNSAVSNMNTAGQ